MGVERFNRRVKGNNDGKVKNTKFAIVDGIKFRSKIEAYTYSYLKEHNIHAEYENRTFILVDKFQYKDEAVRAITYTPDFNGEYKGVPFLIEVKGFQTDAFKLRWKLFKWYLSRNDINLMLYMPKNQKEVRACIEHILSYKGEVKPVSL